MDLKKNARIVLSTAFLTPGLAFGGAFTFIGADAANSRIVRLVRTAEGTPWVIVETPRVDQNDSAYRLLYWDGQALKSPVPEVSCVGAVYSASFFGGSDRDAWVTVMPDGSLSGQGRLCKLGKGTVEASDTFRKISPARQAEIYVARDGRVFNWGESFLACRQTNGVWSRAEAALPVNHLGVPPLIFERDGAVFFFESPRLYVAGADGQVTAKLVAKVPAGDRSAFAHRWGDTRIVIWPNGYQAQPVAFDIDTLQQVAWPPCPAEMGVVGQMAFSTRDGTVWLGQYLPDTERVNKAPSTVRLPPGATRYVAWPEVPFPSARGGPGIVGTALECSDGTMAAGTDGLTLIARDGKTERYDWRHGLSGPAADLQEDAKKCLWFVMNGQVVIFDRTQAAGQAATASSWEEVAVNCDTWLFQPQPGEIACFAKDEPVLLRWNGREWRRQALPFNPYGYNLHRTDDRGVIWVGRTATAEWYAIDEQRVRQFPNEAAAKAASLAEGARQFVGNCGATPEGTNDPSFSGGFFHYPERDHDHFMMAPAVRQFEKHRLIVGTEGTPFAGEYLLRACEDAAGNLWFLVAPTPSIRSFGTPRDTCGVLSKSTRLFRYTPSGDKLAFAAPPPAACGRSLDLPLMAGAAQRQRVLFSRVNEEPWERLGAGPPHALFRFPTNGVYRCQVTAFDYGGKVPGAASFSVAASMELPETRRDGSDAAEPVLVTAQPWYPPVRAVPTVGRDSVRLVWQVEGENAWHPLEPAGGLSVMALKRGKQTLLFSAEEAGFWRDPTPLRLEVCVALSLDDYLACVTKELFTSDPAVRERARQALRDCGPQALERLDELKELVGRQERILAGLQYLRAHPSPKGGAE